MPKKAARRRETNPTVPTRSPKVTAGPCTKTPRHTNTRVYRTVGKTRYCVCDECGETWKRIGPEADDVAEIDDAQPLREFALGLADQLEQAERIAPSEDDENAEKVIVIGDGDANATVDQLRALAKLG